MAALIPSILSRAFRAFEIKAGLVGSAPWASKRPQAPAPIKAFSSSSLMAQDGPHQHRSLDVFSRAFERNKKRYYMDLKQDRDTGLLSAKLSEVNSISKKRSSILIASMEDLKAFIGCLEGAPVDNIEQSEAVVVAGGASDSSKAPYATLKDGATLKTYCFSVLENFYGPYLEVKETFQSPDGLEKVSRIFVNPQALPDLVQGLKEVLNAGIKPRPTLS